ncbi:hypothetical protein RRG08_056730 [Elysia crispata]|uniref:Uncharacterized protein n=1 Tax=Elysia crispata TaxID=231223 RepID=A0AAE1B6D6_9GAST|nr:hypothetical protein RRG08_056730 [Elysia crispata]
MRHRTSGRGKREEPRDLARVTWMRLLAKGARVVFGDIDPTAGAATEQELAEKYGKDNVRFLQCDAVTDGSKFEGTTLARGAVCSCTHSQYLELQLLRPWSQVVLVLLWSGWSLNFAACHGRQVFFVALYGQYLELQPAMVAGVLVLYGQYLELQLAMFAGVLVLYGQYLELQLAMVAGVLVVYGQYLELHPAMVAGVLVLYGQYLELQPASGLGCSCTLLMVSTLNCSLPCLQVFLYSMVSTLNCSLP